MKTRFLIISQRLLSHDQYPETREALDVQWGAFIAALNARLSQSIDGCGAAVVVPLPALIHVPVDVYLGAIPRPMIAGVVLTGGNDISSRTIMSDCTNHHRHNNDNGNDNNQQQHHQAVSAAERLSEMRDEFESRLYHAALRLGVPVMGVCRGCQLIALMQQHSDDDDGDGGDDGGSNNNNDKSGSIGTGAEDVIRGRPIYALRPCPDRSLHVATTHRLVRAAATDDVPLWLSRFEGHHVNSYHNFAVVPGARRDGGEKGGTTPGLKPALLSEQDGSIEALVSQTTDDTRQGPGRILGIMWHPERFQEGRPCDLDLDMFIDFFRLRLEDHHHHNNNNNN